MEQSSIVGVAVDYAGLRKLVAARRQELGLRQLEVDDLAGVQQGYTGKLECGLRHFGDMSLGSILGALGLSLVAMRATGAHKHQSLEQGGLSSGRLADKLKKRNAKGARALNMSLTPLQRSKSAKNAAKVRWSRYRASRPQKVKQVAKKSPAVEAGPSGS